MKRICAIIIFIVAICTSTEAQITTTAYPKDTTSLLYQKYFGTLDTDNNRILPRRRIQINPQYYRLFVPLTFYQAPVDQITEILWKSPSKDTLPDLSTSILPFDVTKYQTFKRTNRQVNEVLLDVYVNHPQWVKNKEQEIMSLTVLTDEVVEKTAPKTSIIDLFKPDKVVADVGEAEIIIHKPNFWTKGGNGSLQFSQNYVSKNWHKGGESTNSLLAHLQFFSNYNDKQKVQFENLFEARIGFNTVPSDTIREYKINTDVLRIFSKLGIRAVSKWYYTLSAEFNTQFFTNYKANSKDVASAFMAPANLMVSLGMDYKLQNKKINLSVIMSPLSYNLRYIGDGRVNETSFGLKEGDKILQDYGSKFQSTLAWTIIPSITLNSRLYYFTNYEKVEAEWENTFNFVLNRYLSTKLFVHARFDDGAKRVEGKSYFQLIELLSFGLNYKW